MKIAIIADDLTGANDTGVKLSKKGILTSVILDYETTNLSSYNSIVIDSDTRNLTSTDAYNIVYGIAKTLKENNFDMIYKKIDSTLRGNIGSELDALKDVFNPDFIVIAPGNPSGGRVLKNGEIYLNDVRIDKTDYGRNVINKINGHDLVNILKSQSNNKSALITASELDESLYGKISEYSKLDIKYLIVDSIVDDDLELLSRLLVHTNYNILWCGSSGLINYLPNPQVKFKDNSELDIKDIFRNPTLTIAGSFNDITLKQIKKYQSEKNIKEFKLDLVRILTSVEDREMEVVRIVEDAIKFTQNNFSILIYATSSQKEIEKSIEIATQNGITQISVRKYITETLGEIAKRITNEVQFKALVVTGGETAKDICKALNIKQIELIDEIEPIIPIGKITMNNEEEVYLVTKGGSIGNENTFVNINQFFTNRAEII